MAGVPTDGTPVERNRVFDAPWVENPTVETRRRLYEAEIEHNDAVVAEFFRRLDETGLARDTLVVLMSDHGEYLGDRGFFGNRMWDHRPPGFMATTHVPLMFVHPARFKEPKRIAAPVQLIDVMPTVLELAGVDGPTCSCRAARWSGWSRGRTRGTGATGWWCRRSRARCSRATRAAAVRCTSAAGTW
jgi:arylsulfatase A-like enzyme